MRILSGILRMLLAIGNIIAGGYADLETSTANDMMLAQNKTTLDQYVVNLFNHRSILAVLMKLCVKEFADLSTKRIMDECFVG